MKDNLVLTGMPSSGKTTVGRMLAASLGLSFVDSDALIVERIGMSIKDFFAARGEAAFRAVESEVLADLAARRMQVIATGGGAILDPRNVEVLRSSGTLLFLDRSLSGLVPTEDRPLSADGGRLERLYRERRPRYLAAADHVIPNDGTPEEALALILNLIRTNTI